MLLAAPKNLLTPPTCRKKSTRESLSAGLQAEIDPGRKHVYVIRHVMFCPADKWSSPVPALSGEAGVPEAIVDLE